MLTLPFVTEIEKAQTVLIAGAGGGFDIFCGLPLYFALRHAGKQVSLANLSFSSLPDTGAPSLAPGLFEVTTSARDYLGYFPELYLSAWFAGRGEHVPIYAFQRTGVQPLLAAYQALLDHLRPRPDAIILVDGGTDSLMRGDEAGLGTPAEDVASIAAVDALDVPAKFLVCLGFGIDAYHGVCHAQVLEAVASLIRSSAFLGTWSLTRDMPEVALYREATQAVFRAMPRHPSIVSSSILSAIAGEFGDYHATQRTRGAELFINALMSLYWCFHLGPVAERILYIEEMRATHTSQDVATVLGRVRAIYEGSRPWVALPM